MGNRFNKTSPYEHCVGDNDAIKKIQCFFDQKFKIPIELQVAHYTPPNFPLTPIINKKISELCSASWNKIISADVTDEHGGTISGLTAFYNEFYERLDLVDSSGRFEAILSRHSSGMNTIAAKGAILLRIISYALNIQEDCAQTQMQLYMLGKSHAQKHIRPWQYSVFVQTLLYTIASRLGKEATSDVMEGWVNIFAFILRSMLPPAIKDQVVETEININTSSEFTEGKLAEEIHEIEETKELQRRIGVGKSSSRSSHSVSLASIKNKLAVPESKKNMELAISTKTSARKVE